MGNQAKAVHTAEHYNEQSTCPPCQGRDSQQHWITQRQTSTLPRTRAYYIAQAEVEIRRERRNKHAKTAHWMEIIPDIAVKHPQGEDVWVGMYPPTLRQIIKSRFENSSIYSNAITDLSEKAMI